MSQAAKPSWEDKRQSLLFAACKAIAALRQDDIPVAHAIRYVAGKFRGRNLGGGRRLALSRKTMQRHWYRWESTSARKRTESIFRSRYKITNARSELNPLLLPLIAEFGIQQGRTVGEVLRVVRPTTANGKLLSKRTLLRRVPAREIQKLAFADRRAAKLARRLADQKAALIERMFRGAAR